MEYRRRRLPWVLIALGAAMALFALGMLTQTPGVLQYCVIAPEPGEKGEAIRDMIASAQKLGEGMKESLAWVAVNGEAGKVSLSSDAGSEEVNLIAMGEGWLEVYPRFLVKGRRIGESELEQGAKVAVLDDGLAFKLFGTDLPENAKVQLNGVDFKVVGTVRHAGSLFGGRGVGDTAEYDAYVPLMAAVNNGVPLQSLTLSALAQGSAGAALLFADAAQNQWRAGGELIDLSKESMRGTVPLRVLLLIVGLYVMVGLFKRMTQLASRWFESYRQALKLSYFAPLIPRLLGIIALSLLGYGALIGLTYLLMVFSVQPLYVFTEWVPENLVEWSSIVKVFWNLTASAGRLVRIGTRELRVVEFWSGQLRWGVILGLLGAALLPKQRRLKHDR